MKTSVLVFHFPKTDVSFDSLSFQWNLGKCQPKASCLIVFFGFFGHFWVIIFRSSKVSAQFEEVKVKIEKVDLWADRMDLVPDGDEGDGFGDGFGADLCLQNLCRDGTILDGD